MGQNSGSRSKSNVFGSRTLVGSLSNVPVPIPCSGGEDEGQPAVRAGRCQPPRGRGHPPLPPHRADGQLSGLPQEAASSAPRAGVRPRAAAHVWQPVQDEQKPDDDDGRGVGPGRGGRSADSECRRADASERWYRWRPSASGSGPKAAC